VSRSKVDAATLDDSGGTPVTAPGYPGPAHVPPPRNRRSEPAWVQAGAGAWLRAGFFIGLGLILAWATANAVWSVRDVLVRVFVAVFLAVSLDPAVRWLVARDMRRGLAVTLISLIFVGIVAGFLISVIPPMVDQFNVFATGAPEYVERLQRESVRFRGLNERFDLAARLEDATRNLPGMVTGGVLGVTRAVFGALANTITVLVFTIYFMLDMPRLRRGVTRLVPRQRRQHFSDVADLVIEKVGAYMIGQLLIATVGGVCGFVAMTLLGVAFPLPLAILIGVTALIPLIGASLGAVIAVLVTAFTTAVWPTAVLLLLFFLVYQQIENYLIGPRIQRSAVNLSAAAVLLAGLLGATALGLLGALMAIPVAAALKVIVLERLDEHEETAV
jgi:predicted PurR-regulated permease PerM